MSNFSKFRTEVASRWRERRVNCMFSSSEKISGEAASSFANDAQGWSDFELHQCALELYERRKLRTKFLSASLLGEPVWDMLLTLYCHALRGETLSASMLCQAAGTSPTTALRWIQLLEQKKLVVRTKDDQDARRAMISLTVQGETVMTEYLAAIISRAQNVLSPRKVPLE